MENFTLKSFFEFLENVNESLEYLSENFDIDFNKEITLKTKRIQNIIVLLQKYIGKTQENEIKSSEELDTFIWNEIEYENFFWQRIIKDIASKLLRVLIFDMKKIEKEESIGLLSNNENEEIKEKSKNDGNIKIIIKNEQDKTTLTMFINSMKWLRIYSYALINFYEKAFKKKENNLDELKFFVCIFLINLKIFKGEDLEIFCFYLYKISGLYFKLPQENIDDDLSTENFIGKNLKKFPNIDYNLIKKIDKMILPSNLDNYACPINLFSYLKDNDTIRPFFFLKKHKSARIDLFFGKYLEEHERTKLVENCVLLKNLKMGLNEMSYCKISCYFYDSIYFIRSKILTDVFNENVYKDENSFLKFFSRAENFGGVFDDIHKFLSDFIKNDGSKQIEKCLKGYLSKEFFINELNNFEENYLSKLLSFMENKIYNEISIEVITNVYEKRNELFAFSIECLFYKKAFVCQQTLQENYVKTIDNIWKSFFLLIELNKKKILVARLPFIETDNNTDFYQYIVYHSYHLSNFDNQEAISDLNMDRLILEDILNRNDGAMKKKIEKILNSKVIRDYYENLDNNLETANKYFIPYYIKEGKFWNKIKLLKLFTFHSGMTLPQLIIILNDHLPGTYDLNSYDQIKIDSVK